MTCKGTFRQVFIRVYRLEIHSVMLVFSTQFCELLALSHSLWLNSPPLPCVSKYIYVGMQCVTKGRGIGQTDKHLPQSHFTGQFFT